MLGSGKETLDKKAKEIEKNEVPKESKKTSKSKNPTIEVHGIIGLFGMQGTGKTYRSLCFNRLGKVLYLDGENKAYEVFNTRFQDWDYGMAMPDKKISNEKANTHIYVFQVLKPNYMPDYLKSIEYFMKRTPFWIKQIESGKFKTVVIDNCVIFKEFGKAMWFKQNPNRKKIQQFEYGDVEDYIRQCLFPFINACKEHKVNLILCYGISDWYIKDEIIGTKEDAKQWLLGLLSYELWLERDYKVYCLKHPYKPFWAYQDEDQNLAEYLFDSEFIEENVEFKEYIQFKEETLVSEQQRRANKKKKAEKQLSLG